jgi:hypothetical protein
MRVIRGYTKKSAGRIFTSRRQLILLNCSVKNCGIYSRFRGNPED